MAQTIKGRTGEWEIVIGLEVHAQVTSTAKLFSGGSTTFGAAPNHNVALVDCALPGMLPVVNRECIAQAVRTGLGIKAKINLTSVFGLLRIDACIHNGIQYSNNVSLSYLLANAVHYIFNNTEIRLKVIMKNSSKHLDLTQF